MRAKSYFALFSISLLSSTPCMAGSAQVVAAQSDVNAIGNAMVQFAIDTNFFTTIENLDDLSGVTSTYPFDYINDNGGALVVDLFSGTFRSSRINLLTRPLGLNYNGPYVSPFSNLASVGRFTDNSHFYDEGHPLDPWFNPYLFYSPLGLMVPDTENVTLDFHGDEFDRYTVLSLGPDGVVSSDDIKYSISGYSITSLAISSVRLFSTGSSPAAKSSGLELRIKGYNFGSTQGTGGVTVGGSPVTVSSWSDNVIIVEASTPPLLTETVEVTRNGGGMVSFTGILDETVSSSVDRWLMYED